MNRSLPPTLSKAELRRRTVRVRRLARTFGFVGLGEYQHVFSTTGGAQFGLASSAEQDKLTVFAEAFLRDENRDEFSLEAIIAHEVGHQIVWRNPRLKPFRQLNPSLATEEILASLLGSIIVESELDKDDLVSKAIAEMLEYGIRPKVAAVKARELRELLESVV